jgi:hypothetical protein
MKKHSKTADLLRVLGAKIPPGARPLAPKTGPVTRATARIAQKPRPQKRPAPRATSHAERRPVRGKAVQFWLHDEDQRLIREFALWLLSQRKRINSSLVVKTILRAAKTGPELLAAYDKAVKVDARLPQKRTPER